MFNIFQQRNKLLNQNKFIFSNHNFLSNYNSFNNHNYCIKFVLIIIYLINILRDKSVLFIYYDVIIF